ncbi:MAG: hypothetical protein Q7J82_10080 [Coriobacteriia bacterium]|nr:hypothetical protein [Coriobacteriia bacterium]
MPHRPYEDVRVTGHLIDSGIMSKIMDAIVAFEAEFETLSFEVGRTNEDASVAEIRVHGKDEHHLDEVLGAIQMYGAEPIDPEDAHLALAPADGVFPEGFYATTNLDTAVRVSGRWIQVADPEMDLGIIIDVETGVAATVPMGDVKAGDEIVVGHSGLRVRPVERPRDAQAFEFMNSAVSSEKPKAQVINDVITDTVEAQRAMRPYCQEAGACIMLSTMLHAIATGNMLPASCTTVCVDINPAVVTKLSDRGSFQTIGIVTDVGLFLEQLANELDR